MHKYPTRDAVNVSRFYVNMSFLRSVWFTRNHSGTGVGQAFLNVDIIKTRNTILFSTTCSGSIPRKLSNKPPLVSEAW